MNGDGYYDETAAKAIENVNNDKDTKRFYKLLHTIFTMCELAGFHLEGRITLKDRKTGKIYE